MRRAVTVWQIVVLLLLLSAVVSTYVVLAATWQRLHVRQQSAQPIVSAPGRVVQLLAPRPGALYRLGDPIPVEVATTGEGYVQVELLVDGQSTDTRTSLDPTTVSGLVEFSWVGPIAAEHTLAAQARDTQEAWTVSEAVTITIVPTGHLLFASNRDGSYAIYEMTSDGRDPTRLTMGPGDARQPCALPDGTLVYAADTGDGRSVIYLVLGRGEPSPIVAGVDPACSTNAARLACVAGVDGASQVLTVHPWGGVPRTVTAEVAYAGQPAWSPDSSQIAYVADRDGNWDIWVVPAVGGQAARLTEDPALDWAPAWSPDGTRLAFVSNRDGSHQVYTMHVDGTHVERVTDHPRGAESPAWSPDGFWLAFVAYGGAGSGVSAREVYLVRADGRYAVRVTDNNSDDTDVTWTAGH